MKLTERQKKFIDYYIQTGNATESCRLAGYKGNNLDRIGYENLRKLEIFIKPRIEQLDLERTANLEEIFEFWTSIIRDEDIKISDRLKSSELLAKSQGAFVEKIETKEIHSNWFKWCK